MLLAHQIAGLLGILACLGLGIVGTFRPQLIMNGAGISTNTGHGQQELRALMGGTFLGLTAALLFIGTPDVYQVVAYAFFGVVVAKLYGQVVDKPAVKNSVPGIIIDLVLGLLLLAGSFADPLIVL